MVPSKYLSATAFKGSLVFNLESSCGAPARFRNVSRVRRPASIHSDTGWSSCLDVTQWSQISLLHLRAPVSLHQPYFSNYQIVKKERGEKKTIDFFNKIILRAESKCRSSQRVEKSETTISASAEKPTQKSLPLWNNIRIKSVASYISTVLVACSVIWASVTKIFSVVLKKNQIYSVGLISGIIRFSFAFPSILT